MFTVFAAKCPSCQRLYEIKLDTVSKVKDDRGREVGKLLCCPKCKDHSVLMWITPYNVHSMEEITLDDIHPRVLETDKLKKVGKEKK